MSEEDNRKRQRDEFEDDYEPTNNDESTLPPHMMETGNDEGYDDYIPPHKIEDSISNNVIESNIIDTQIGGIKHSHDAVYDNGSRKRQRRVKLSAEIERAYELCSNLQALGDNSGEVKILLTQSSETMAYFWSDDDFSSNLIKFIGAVVVELPHKSNLFSGLIMLANAKNDQIGKDIILWLKERINEVFNGLENGIDYDDNLGVDQQMNHGKNWNKIILILRMLGLLVSIIDDFDNVLELVNQLLMKAIELQNLNNERSGLSQLLYYQILLSIPYFLVNDPKNEELKNKLKETIKISSEYQVNEDLNAKYFKPIHSDDESCVNYDEILNIVPQLIEDYLDDLSLFYNVNSIIDPLIKTVLSEKAMTLEKVKNAENEDNEMKIDDDDDKDNDNKNDDDYNGNNETNVSTDNKIEQEVSKHSIGKFEVPDISIFQKYEDLNKFSSISDKLWKFPRFLLRIFSFENIRKELEFETLPDYKSYVSLILHDIMTNILFNVEYNRVTVSKQFLNLQVYFNEKIFSKSNSPLDKLMIINDLKKGLDFDLVKNLENSEDFEESIKHQMINSAKRIQFEFENGYKSTWKMEEIVLETIINFIFNIPESEIPLIYFETLLSDTCGRDWTLVKRTQLHSNESLVFSKLVGDCFRYFYNNLEKLEFEIIKRFINWFLIQISNFKFEWEWQEWVTDIIQLGDEQIYNPKLFFIKNIIHKELLITNYKFIRSKTLPKDFKKFANLSLKTKEELIKFDSKFFGEEFANKNTIEPFEEINDDELNGEFEDSTIETNTDSYKLFSHYLFNHDEHPYNDICRDIYMNLENVDENIESLIELTNKLKEKIEIDYENNNNNNNKIVEDSDEYIITLIIESICLIGSRSFSVFEESLNKVFGDKLNYIFERIENPNKIKWVINAVLRIWNNEPRIGLLFIEKLLRFGIFNEFNIIETVWNCCENKILPLAEIFADEYLERIIEFADEEDGDDEINKQNELILFYLQLFINKLNEITIDNKNKINLTTLENLDDKSLDSEWEVKNLIGLFISKLRRYKGFGVNFEEVLQNIEDEELRGYLTKVESCL
jgi:nuclear cap-binding protein subunit 1